MADNFLQFSFRVAELTDDDICILLTLRDLQVDLDPLWDAEVTGQDSNAPLPKGWEKHFTKDEINQYWGMFGGPAEEDELHDLGGVDLSIQEDRNQRYLWVRAELYGDPGAVVELIQVWLRKTNSNRIITFTWAETCSSMRADEFSGGGVAFNKDEVFWVSPGRMINQWAEAHDKGE